MFLVVLAGSPSLFSQNKAPVSDPEAMTLALKSVAAMSGTTAVADVTLTGDAIRTLGSDKQVGTATLSAKSFGESRVDLALKESARSEVRNSAAGPKRGAWSGSDRVLHPIAPHNCLTDTTWFFPALGSLATAATDPNVVLVYMGQGGQGQSQFHHIQAYTYNSYLQAAEALSVMDFYLDTLTLLPSVVTFNEHPDTDQTTNVSVQVMFSDYRSVNGALVPFHIQRYVNTDLTIDVQVTSVAINSGISDDVFSTQ